jgi:dTDP-4-dehydrorhamnose reductase
VSGMSGTVAPRVAAQARSRGHEVLAWRRDEVPPDDTDACRGHLAESRPDGILHMAFGPESWAALLADHARQHSIPFVFTSTAMVFAPRPDGPYTITSPRTADEDYGQYKIRCEDAIWAANPDAMIARLGYQIDPDGRGNNMVAHVDAEQARHGRVTARTRWLPACAFLDDTCGALLGLVDDPDPGLHHLDANARTAWSHAEILARLATALGRTWDLVDSDEPVHDQRLVDSRLIAGLEHRLG